MKKTIKMLAMSAFCVVLAGAPAFAAGETNDPTCVRSSVAVSVELDQTWKNALNNNEDAIEVFEQLLAGGLVFEPEFNRLQVTAFGRSPFPYPVSYSYGTSTVESSSDIAYIRLGAETEITVTAAFPQQIPLQYGYLHFDVNENASPVDFVLLKSDGNLMQMNLIVRVDGVPRELSEPVEFGNNMNSIESLMGANLFYREGYELRGWTINARIPDVKTSISFVKDASNFGIGHGSSVSGLASILNTMQQKVNTLYFVAYPAYAAACSANTIPSADHCDTINPDTRGICSLRITRDGEVIYTNGCCTGFNLADSTATE